VFRRSFWFGAGATAGLGCALWVRRRVLRTVHRYTPDRVQADVTASMRRLGSDLRAAVTEGRSAMASREAELRAELRPGPELPPGPERRAAPSPEREATPTERRYLARGERPRHH
jgi:hypothetical protein